MWKSAGILQFHIFCTWNRKEQMVVTDASSPLSFLPQPSRGGVRKSRELLEHNHIATGSGPDWCYMLNQHVARWAANNDRKSNGLPTGSDVVVLPTFRTLTRWVVLFSDWTCREQEEPRKQKEETFSIWSQPRSRQTNQTVQPESEPTHCFSCFWTTLCTYWFVNQFVQTGLTGFGVCFGFFGGVGNGSRLVQRFKLAFVNWTLLNICKTYQPSVCCSSQEDDLKQNLDQHHG